MEKKFRYRNQTEQLLGELGGAGRSIAAALWEQKAKDRIASLDDTVLANGTVIEVVGIPRYLEDVTAYEAYGLTESGWYCFARITARDGSKVDANTTITGDAGHIMLEGASYIDVAVKFDVAAMKQRVIIDWGTYEDDIVFSASDLAVRNLDYRTTFYVYDIAPYTTWEYALTTDTTFVDGKRYYTKDENDEYHLAEVEPYSYALTADETFQTGKTYYTKDGDVYTAATVTAGEAVTAGTYYERSAVTVPANTYYNHSKVTFSGMARNITYILNEPVDCPQVYVLPEIEDDTHGCWYEVRLRHTGSFSSTLQVPEGVKVATEHTQAETAGMNMVDLHYTNIDGVKLWRFLNTHSSIPA